MGLVPLDPWKRKEGEAVKDVAVARRRGIRSVGPNGKEREIAYSREHDSSHSVKNNNINKSNILREQQKESYQEGPQQGHDKLQLTKIFSTGKKNSGRTPYILRSIHSI